MTTSRAAQPFDLCRLMIRIAGPRVPGLSGCNIFPKACLRERLCMDVQFIINDLCSGSVAGTCIVHIQALWTVLGIVASACAALVVAIWLAIRWAYATVVRHKDAEIGSLKTLVDSYKDKLDGATPDEAQARIAELERTVQRLKPRSLTRSKWRKSVAAQSGPYLLLKLR